MRRIVAGFLVVSADVGPAGCGDDDDDSAAAPSEERESSSEESGSAPQGGDLEDPALEDTKVEDFDEANCG